MEPTNYLPGIFSQNIGGYILIGGVVQAIQRALGDLLARALYSRVLAELPSHLLIVFAHFKV